MHKQTCSIIQRCQREQGGSSSGNHAEDDGYDQAFGAGPSAGNMDEHIISITSFERLMISCMDNLA